jgi:hypothetical protein
MSYHFLDTPSAEVALERYTGMFDRIGMMASADERCKALVTAQVTFCQQALAMLQTLNDFDLKMVLLDILHLSENPNQPLAQRNKFNYWQSLWRSRYPFDRYHYMIQYLRDPAGPGIVIEDVYLDTDLLKSQVPTRNERNALYEVRAKRTQGDQAHARMSKSQYPGIKTIEEGKALPTFWAEPLPVTQVQTRFAAVNGMQNSLTKASWLMGEHVKAAFSDQPIDVYTLFHNPTESVGRDLAECLWDKGRGRLPFSAQADHLAAILRQQQQLGRRTDWVAHSQGAIIFMAAISHHLAFYGSMKLDKQRVALHAGGSVGTEDNRALLARAGIELLPERICPFDLVPNIAGGNDLTVRGVVRAMLFLKNVFSNNGGNPAVSPHTRDLHVLPAAQGCRPPREGRLCEGLYEHHGTRAYRLRADLERSEWQSVQIAHKVRNLR